MNSIYPNFRLSPDLWKQMAVDVAARSTEEACGFVVGRGNTSRMVIPVTNILHDPYRYRMDPQEELNAFMLAEKLTEDIIAIYHSHPHGIDHPSATDIEELTFPGIIYLIWYQCSGKWECRAYLMETDSRPVEVDILISTNLER